jgi:hypothetical protein
LKTTGLKNPELFEINFSLEKDKKIIDARKTNYFDLRPRDKDGIRKTFVLSKSK